MNAPSSSETAKPLEQFVNAHPWLFILALLVTVEIILFPVSLLIKIFLLSLRAPVQPIKYLIELSLVIVAFVFLSQLSWWRQTGFMKGIGWKDVLVCLFPTLLDLSGAPFVFLLLISGSVKISLGQLVLIAIFSCLIGVAEESFYRGLILQTLLPKGVLRAIFLSALLFALLHVANLFVGLSGGYVLGQVLNAFGGGIAYAVMRVRTGSIWPAIILHSLSDFDAFVIIRTYGVGHPTLLDGLLSGGIICSLYLIYAAIALRPSKLSELCTRYQPETRSSAFRGRFFLTLKGDPVLSPQVSQTGGFTQVIKSKKASTIGFMVIVSVFLVALLGSGIFYLTRGAHTGSTNPIISTSTPAATPSPCLELVSKLTDTSSAPSVVTFNNTSHTYTQAPPVTIDTKKVYCAGINTNRGLIVLELDPQLAPKTVNNFVFLAQHHFYDGLIFHRVVPHFIIQTGDPKGNGTGGPGYKFNDEPVKGDYTAGTVAMANARPNTNGSQFFICTADDTKVIEKLYNLFGHVVKGLDVAQRIQGPGDTPASKHITPDIINHLIVVVAP